MWTQLRWLTGLMLMLTLALTGCSKSEEPKTTQGSEAGTSDKAEQKTVTWRFALEEVEGSVQDAYAKEFKNRIEEASGGSIKVEVYPYGALGTSSQLTELVQGGALELAFASPGHLASVIPEVGVFTLHFVLSDDNDINKEVLSSEAVHSILQPSYQQQGLELLSIVPEGWMVWTADKPLTSPEDFDGFKIRTMTSPILVQSYEAYGANPTPLPYAEVYSALQLGQIDGQVNPVFAIEEMSFYEEQDVMTFANHAQFVATVVAGQQWRDTLSDQQEQWLDQTIEGMVDWIYSKQEQYNKERLQTITQDGGTQVVELTDEQREAFRKASMDVRQVYLEQAGENGKKLLEAITSKVAELEGAQEESN